MSINSEVDWLLNDFKASQMSNTNIGDINAKAGNTAGCVLPCTSGITKEQHIAQLSFIDNIFREAVEPKVGSILAISLGFVLEHTGIYIGNGKVIELYGDGYINEITLKQFLNGAYDLDPSFLSIVARTGVNIYTACSNGKVIANKQVAERAITISKSCKKIDYSVLNNNCHMFSGFCLFGKNFQKNKGCRFFTNLTLGIIENFQLNLDDFKWQIIEFNRN